MFDEYNDCYICPANPVLEYMETCEDIRHTIGIKVLYSQYLYFYGI